MKHTLFIWIVLITTSIIILSSCKDNSDNVLQADGIYAPDFKLGTPDGETIMLSDYQGEVVILDFWASWCTYCFAENPNVVAFYNQYHDQGLEIIGLSIDEDDVAWKKAITSQQLPYLQVIDPDGWNSNSVKHYNIVTIPHLVLIDREGIIVATANQIGLLEIQLIELLNAEN